LLTSLLASLLILLPSCSWQCIPLENVECFSSAGDLLNLTYELPSVKPLVRDAICTTFRCADAAEVHEELAAAADAARAVGRFGPRDGGTAVPLPSVGGRGAERQMGDWVAGDETEGEEEVDVDEEAMVASLRRGSRHGRALRAVTPLVTAKEDASCNPRCVCVCKMGVELTLSSVLAFSQSPAFHSWLKIMY
jgi:hypothetical protein